MINKNVITVSVPQNEIVINPNEAAMRLRVPREYKSEAVSICEKNLRRVLNCRLAYVKMPVVFKENNICNIGFDVESEGLCRALGGCTEAYILGVTIGIEADRLISRLSYISPTESFITDALASSAAEALCDYADKMLRGEDKKPFRFSAGYGDMPLSYQKKLLNILNSEFTLGIKLNKADIMVPTKSITAIMGVYND